MRNFNKGNMVLVFLILILGACNGSGTKRPVVENLPAIDDVNDSIAEQTVTERKLRKVIIEKELLYTQHTLADTFPYKDTVRIFQWNKIRDFLAVVDSIQEEPAFWGILQNRHNKNGLAPLVNVYHRNAYNNVTDTFGIERYQGIPLFLESDSVAPFRYALDGTLVKVEPDTTIFIQTHTIYFAGEWIVPKKYIQFIADTVVFNKVLCVDRTNQNIATLEKVDSVWLVRSMNPATTGVHRPPYMHETPPGIFVIQEKRLQMIFLKDGTDEEDGFAPYANRFCNGGYIHGVPVNYPRTEMIEFSRTLGTTPRSHMCVRNATSHSKFIYNWAPTHGSLVYIFD